MRCHIICHVDGTDPYHPVVPSDDRRLHVYVGARASANRVRNNITEVLSRASLSASLPALDLAYAAISVFTADMRVPRDTFADNWTRSFVLHLPVADQAAWTAAAPLTAKTLSYLTGDRWEIQARARTPAPFQARQRSAPGFDSVVLFSGGLDSFVGAVDRLEDGGRVALVAHYAEGTSSAAQDGAYAAVQAAKDYLKRTTFHKFYVSPPLKLTMLREETMRSRSFLFLALGLLVCSAYGKRVPLTVAENGFISLNVPLTPSREGSLSTRTTHPHFIRLFGELARSVGLENELRLPYQFETKGEMLDKCKNKNLLRKSFGTTMSCAHPAAARWTGGNTKNHCGYCVPCLVRRAALLKVGLNEPYNFDVTSVQLNPKTKRGEDIQAVRMALLRYAGMGAGRLLMELLKSGPIEMDTRKSADVFARGLDELNALLRIRP